MTKEVWDRFQYKTVICCCKYQDRVTILNKELLRVGLSDVNYSYDAPSKFLDRLKSQIHFWTKGAADAFRASLNHYNAIQRAYNLGYDSTLIIEDDIRFLKDEQLLVSIIESLPDDYDVALFEKMWNPTQFQRKEQVLGERINEYWIKGHGFVSASCYALSRAGMENFIKAYEHDFEINNLKTSDQYWHEQYMGDKVYAATPNAAIQFPCGTNGMTYPKDAYAERNEDTDTHYEQYNLPYPFVIKRSFHTHLFNTLSKQSDPMKLEGFPYCRWPDERMKLIQNTNLWKMLAGSQEGSGKITGFIWGYLPASYNCECLQTVVRTDSNMILCEDGFIRSIETAANKSAMPSHLSQHSIVFDRHALYFDAVYISDIERMLNDSNLIITSEQRTESRRLIAKVVNNKISKYNHQPIFTPKIGREGARKVLVVDQSYGDFSIKRGLADESTFEKMLQTAIDENPEADILVKTHPDTLAGKKAEKKGYYQDLKEQGNIHKVTFPINPYSLMEVCDKVYVCSSQFGIEALMAGKEVHVFGMPFYAGWGLTIDAQHLDRRTNKRTLEELFYIFYCLYTHWVDPDKGCETTIDAVIDKMIALRKEYKQNTHIGQFQQSVRNKPMVPLHESSEPFAARVSCPTRPLTFPMPRRNRGAVISHGFVGGNKHNGLGMFF